MKKYNLLKVLAIVVFVTWILTLIIPGSYVDYSGKVTTNTIAGLGVWGLLTNLNISISYFNSIAVFLIAVACFYAILNKVKLYNEFVSNVSKIFKGKEKNLVIITTLVFGILSLFVNDFLILIAFVPFVYKVMKELSIDKKVILASTLVAALIGSMCSIYNSTLFTAFSLKINTLLLVKIILFVVSISVLTILIAPKNSSKKPKTASKEHATKEELKVTKTKKVTTKSKTKKVNKVLYAVLTILFGSIGINKFYAGQIKKGILSIVFCWTLIPAVLSIAEFITVLTEKADKDGKIEVVSERRSKVAFIVSIIIFTLFIIASMIPYESLFENCTIFTDFNSWLSNLKIGNYAIFNNIIGSPLVVSESTGSSTGSIAVFGSWTMSDVSILLFILTLLIAIINNVKTDDFIKSINENIKKILPIAITAMLISIVLVIMVTSGISVTIANKILSIFKGFNVAETVFATMISSLLTSDFYYLISTVGQLFTISASNSQYYGVIAFIIQSIYNLVMIVAPTSVGLIIGLYYLDIPYNKWFKFIWKLLLILFVIIVIAAIIIYALV